MLKNHSSIVFVFMFLFSTLAPAKNLMPRGNGNFPGFPPYPKSPNTDRGTKPWPAFQTQPDSLGNRITPDHKNRIDFASGRMGDLMKNMQFTGVVFSGRNHYTNFYRHDFEHRQPKFDNYFHRYNKIRLDRYPHLNLWHKHRFFGGFHYGFHPELQIDSYFYNPVVYWFYANKFDEPLYRSWYVTEYEAYPQLHRPFMYHGVYFPTENLRLLLFGVSAMSVQKQVQFRDAITLFTQRMAQALADKFSEKVRLSTGDITVTHYELLGFDDAVVLEGFVTVDDKAYDFKGLLDLKDTNSTAVIAPVSLDKKPSTEQIKTLEGLNKRISEIQGDDSSVVAQPENDEAVEAQPAAGEVVAEPKK
jgi:hypothetical protein